MNTNRRGSDPSGSPIVAATKEPIQQAPQVERRVAAANESDPGSAITPRVSPETNAGPRPGGFRRLARPAGLSRTLNAATVPKSTFLSQTIPDESVMVDVTEPGPPPSMEPAPIPVAMEPGPTPIAMEPAPTPFVSTIAPEGSLPPGTKDVITEVPAEPARSKWLKFGAVGFGVVVVGLASWAWLFASQSAHPPASTLPLAPSGVASSAPTTSALSASVPSTTPAPSASAPSATTPAPLVSSVAPTSAQSPSANSPPPSVHSAGQARPKNPQRPPTTRQPSGTGLEMVPSADVPPSPSSQRTPSSTAVTPGHLDDRPLTY